MDLPDISDFFADILTFFHDGWENWKFTRGSTAGPEGRSGGRSEARSAERRPERSPEGPAAPPRVVSIYFIFSFHEYHQNLPNTSGFNFLIFRVSWIPSKVREYHLRQEPNTWGFNFWFSCHMNITQGFQVFHVKIMVNTIKNFQRTQWNLGHKIKKICAVFIEITHWCFFDKNTALEFVIYLVSSEQYCENSVLY